MTENIQVFEQNSIRIESGSGVIYVDPFRVPGEFHDADFIFVTHEHYDHFSPEDLARVSGAEAVLIVPESMAKKAKKAAPFVRNVVTVLPGISGEVKGLSFETVPAYNENKPFHPKKNGWVGYVLEIDGKRVYVAGDTDATEEASDVRADIALVPVGGTYTMDAAEAAALVNKIHPDIAIPVHYGTVVGRVEDGETFRKAVDPKIRVKIKIGVPVTPRNPR